MRNGERNYITLLLTSLKIKTNSTNFGCMTLLPWSLIQRGVTLFVIKRIYTRIIDTRLSNRREKKAYLTLRTFVPQKPRAKHNVEKSFKILKEEIDIASKTKSSVLNTKSVTELLSLQWNMKITKSMTSRCKLMENILVWQFSVNNKKNEKLKEKSV